jgi:hypothetical protein
MSAQNENDRRLQQEQCAVLPPAKPLFRHARLLYSSPSFCLFRNFLCGKLVAAGDA